MKLVRYSLTRKFNLPVKKAIKELAVLVAAPEYPKKTWYLLFIARFQVLNLPVKYSSLLNQLLSALTGIDV